MTYEHEKPILQMIDLLKEIAQNTRPRQKQPKKHETRADGSIALQLAQQLFDAILTRKPDFKRPDLSRWAAHIDRLIRIDKRDPRRIGEIIAWCQADDFWQNNILSTDKLRKQWDRLDLQAQAAERKGEGLVAKLCIVDRKPGHRFKTNQQGKNVWLCADCYKAWKSRRGNAPWGWYLLAEVERIVLEGKANG